LSFESLEQRLVLAIAAVTLADPSFWGASAAGISGNSSSFSSDGQLIALESDAGNLTQLDFNGLNDVFVRDLGTGTTVLVSATPSGVSANGPSFNPQLSADGRYVLFESDATDLWPAIRIIAATCFGAIYRRAQPC
jgi:Tol biopolymer transport system component